MRTSRGVFVVLLGPDGAGKSTVLDRVQRDLRSDFPSIVRFHFAPSLFRRRSPSLSVTDPHGQPARSRIGSLAKIAYWLVDYTIGYALKVRPELNRSSLVLFDRYFMDVLVDPRRYRYGGPQWLTQHVWGLVPKPDTVILLDAPVEVLRSRKSEVSTGETERQREAYRNLVERLPRGRIVDAAAPIDDVAADVNELVRDCLSNRVNRSSRRIL